MHEHSFPTRRSSDLHPDVGPFLLALPVYGYSVDDVFNEIQRSNMSKLGLDGQPIFRKDGKVLKGPNYFKPNILKILNS
jgi:hypothetical protein